jgi:hypothetical protein
MVRSDSSIGKSKVINKAIADIGMGRYQWQLFCLCGFGWLADKYVLQTMIARALQLIGISAYGYKE